jgi:hypothetical protein
VANLIDSEIVCSRPQTAVEGEVAILENQKVQLPTRYPTSMPAQGDRGGGHLIEIELRDVEYLFGKG